MTTKRHLRARACGTKRRYPDEASAKRAALAAKRDFGGYQQVYRCEFCDGWHYGRRRIQTGRKRKAW